MKKSTLRGPPPLRFCGVSLWWLLLLLRPLLLLAMADLLL